MLMQAPKNGFFYVLDRTNGKLLSARNFVPVNWASGIDMKTGRPIENPQARYYRTGKPFIGSPGATGAHSWHPMAFDPRSRTVFIPANLAAFPYIPEKGWRANKLGFNVGVDIAAAAMPADKAVRAAAMNATTGALIAWDPVAQKEKWRVSYKGPWNGGAAGDRRRPRLLGDGDWRLQRLCERGRPQTLVLPGTDRHRCRAHQL